MRPLIRSAFLFTVLLGSVPACGSPPAATPAAPATVADEFAPAQLRADFRHLYAQLQASHYDLFARRPRGEYDALFEEMLASLDRPLDREAARRRFQRFVAFGNVAHASIAASAAGWETFRAGGGKAFPLFLRVVGDKAYVADDYSGVGTITQGMRVLAIDGQPVLDWLAPLRAQVSADTDYLAYAQMEMRLPMLVWEQHGARDDFLVELAGEGGAPVRITVPTRDRAGFEAADAARGERFDSDWNARETRMLDDGIAYLRPGPFYDNRPEAEHPWDPAAFTAFVDDAFAGFIAAGARHVLVDLRNNPGGDNSFSDRLVAWFADRPFRFSDAFDIRVSQAAIESNRKRLEATGAGPDSSSARLARAYAGQPLRSRVALPIPLVPPRATGRFEGGVHLLVNRHSYSNAVLVAAMVQDYGFGTVLGEETADLASTFGAMETFTLPHTGIEVGFPKARILRPNGNVEPRGVVPDHPIPSPLEATQDDVVLRHAISIVRKRP